MVIAMEDITMVIRKCLEEVLETDLSNLSESDELSGAGLDSISFVKFIVLLEEKLDFTLNDSDLLMEYFTTIEKTKRRLSSYNLKGYNQPFSDYVPERIIKCLVLDCDNVLWGGIYEEVGRDGILLGQGEIGAAYQDFQREILRVRDKGLLIALCSKNNESDIWDVFDHHAGMIIKREHITTHRINWLDKPENLLSLAEELNLGLDSFLFVDDSEYEIERVRTALPQVETLRLNPDRPHEYAALFRGILGDIGSTLPGRASMYREQKERETSKGEFISLEEYHKSLVTTVTVGKAKHVHIPRIAEISARTNQFNLTGRRYTEAELIELLSKPEFDIFILDAADKFGDMGIVSASFVRYDRAVAHIEAFFLSCRAFGRFFEQIMLSRIIDVSMKMGCSKAVGYYTPSDKNSRFASFWTDNGFIHDNEEYSAAAGAKITYPDIFSVIRMV